MGRPAALPPRLPGADMLARLSSPAPSIPAADVLVVVAHPDDETIGLGGQLARLSGLALVHVTDGAPRGGAAAEHGFADAEAYAAARRRELEAAMAVAGIGPGSLIGLGMPDQQACLDLAGLSRRLAALCAGRGIRTVFTHAYEGGHPDHDAVAFAVHAAARLLAAEGVQPEVIEMPFYHLGPEGWAVQRFPAGPGGEGVTLALTAEQRARKQRMLEAHRSQAGILALMQGEAERFRPAPLYDFRAPPNGGRLLYEGHDWGMTGARFGALAGAALRDLGLA